MNKLSATAQIKRELEIISKKNRKENDLTFNELWDKLEESK